MGLDGCRAVVLKKTMKEIEQYIKELEVEIQKSGNEVERGAQLVRLQEAAANYTGEDELIETADVLERMKNRPEEKRVMSGYKDLDAILDGFRPKQLVVVSAATKSGKTSFCIELTARMKDENPIWIPFEESAEELIQKFLDRGEDPPHFYTPAHMTGNTLAWVEKKIIEGRAKFDSGIVFIDHLHFIIPMTADRQDLAIGHAMRELKRMARQWNIIVVIIAHLKKTRMDMQPTLEDLRDSSFVAQEADTVLMLYRQTEKRDGDVVITNNINISVQANRRTGKTGNVKMVYQDGHFLPLDWKRGAEADWNNFT